MLKMFKKEKDKQSDERDSWSSSATSPPPLSSSSRSTSMNDPKTARRGVGAGALGMGLAILGTLPPAGDRELGQRSWPRPSWAWPWEFRCRTSRSTAVPQRTALSHAFGGLAAGLVGAAKYYLWLGEGGENLTPFRMTALVFEIILGFLTFTGSLMAAGKLQEVKFIPQRPVTYPFQNAEQPLAARRRGGVWRCSSSGSPWS